MFVHSKLVHKPWQERTNPCVGCAFGPSQRFGKTLIARISQGFDFLAWLGGNLPSLMPAAGPSVGEEGDSPEHRYDGG